jgi:predicted DCC family thiol-disulfide oxidoreductase YuxK
VRTVVWDSRCSYCRKWVTLFRVLDWFRLHHFVGSANPRAFDDQRVTPEMADRAIQLVTSERRVEGFEAVRRILAVCPLTFWTAPILWLPPVRHLGNRAYIAVAARRSCRID